MEFQIDKGALVRALAHPVDASERKTTIPILSTVRVEATEDGQLKICGTDLECEVTKTVQVGDGGVTSPGALCIPAKKFSDFVKLLPDGGMVRLKATDNQWLSVMCNRSRTRIACQSVDSFPETQQALDVTLTIPAALMVSLIRRTTFAISQEESRFTLHGCLFERYEGGLRMVATDGHRLAFVDVERYGGEPFSQLIPKRALDQLTRMCAGGDPELTLSCGFGENNLMFVVGDERLVARKLTGRFPDYQRVLPSGDMPITAVVDRDEFRSALMRARKFADERSSQVRIGFAEGQVTVVATGNEGGETDESVSAEVVGEMLSAFNASYLVEYLGTVDMQKVRLEARDANSAMRLSPAGASDKSLCVVMPMRL